MNNSTISAELELVTMTDRNSQELPSRLLELNELVETDDEDQENKESNGNVNQGSGKGVRERVIHRTPLMTLNNFPLCVLKRYFRHRLYSPEENSTTEWLKINGSLQQTGYSQEQDASTGIKSDRRLWDSKENCSHDDTLEYESTAGDD